MIFVRLVSKVVKGIILINLNINFIVNYNNTLLFLNVLFYYVFVFKDRILKVFKVFSDVTYVGQGF